MSMYILSAQGTNDYLKVLGRKLWCPSQTYDAAAVNGPEGWVQVLLRAVSAAEAADPRPESSGVGKALTDVRRRTSPEANRKLLRNLCPL